MEIEVIKVSCNTIYVSECNYIMDIIFGEWLDVDFQLIIDNKISDLYRIECSGNSIEMPNTLFRTNIDKWLHKNSLPSLPLDYLSVDTGQNFKIFSKSIPILFGQGAGSYQFDRKNTFFPIDLFGGIFYCITLYEEMIPVDADKHDRYDFHNSILYKENIHHRAIANEYLELLKSLFKVHFNWHDNKEREYQVHVSHDVDFPLALDVALSRKLRNLAADVYIRKSLPLFFKRLIGFLTIGKNKYYFDPCNNFSYIMDCSERYKLKSEFNFITIDGKWGIDGGYNIESPFFQDLLLEIHERGHLIGFHPSYYTFLDFEKTKQEFEILTNICSKLGIKQIEFGGRQHYLRWKNPDTWQIWNDVGLSRDSSVGYSGTVGFRASCCYSYSAFNLRTRKHLELIEQPLILMDGSLFNVVERSKVIELTQKISDVTKYFKGDFTFLFHNNYAISTFEKKQYEEILSILTIQDNDLSRNNDN